MSFISYSEAFQDAWVYRQLPKSDGIFFDIGANDPFWNSNSYGLERLGWKGILVEHNPTMADACRRYRKNPIICNDASKINWRNISFNREVIDYLSLDIDDHATIPTLENLTDAGLYFRTATIEHDRYSIGDHHRNQIREVMLANQYALCWPDVRCESGEYEDWWTFWPKGQPMKNKWLGTRKQNERYGTDDTSYARAAAFLDHGPVEDWGAGARYARNFFRNDYTAIDGTDDFADIVSDLRTYHNPTYGILIRHVLEHNFDWELILENALASCVKLALVIFTPFGDLTRQIAWNEPWDVPDISFKKEDITDCFKDHKYTEEVVGGSGTCYGRETIFYVDI